jgi:dethiobiotin synthetase
MKTLFIVATNTDVGKSYASQKLIEALSKKGLRIGVFKPIETGVENNEPLDATALLNSVKLYNEAFTNLSPKDITAYTFKLPAAPFVADVNKEINIELILTKKAQLHELCDILIIESAGGLMTPINEEYKMIDLIKTLGAKTLLVTPSKLGCINDTLLAMEALKRREIEYDWCVNLYKDKEHFDTITKPYYDALFPHWWSLQEGLVSYINKIVASRKSTH